MLPASCPACKVTVLAVLAHFLCTDSDLISVGGYCLCNLQELAFWVGGLGIIMTLVAAQSCELYFAAPNSYSNVWYCMF